MVQGGWFFVVGAGRLTAGNGRQIAHFLLVTPITVMVRW
jgi:hypothetical protein